MMKRRAFIRDSAAATLGLLTLGTAGIATAGNSWLDKLGLQLFTVDTLLRQDFEATLRTVADIGYRQVEFSTGGGLHGRSPMEVKEMLAAMHLNAPLGRIRPALPADIDLAALPREEAMKLFAKAMGSDNLQSNIEAMLPEASTLGYHSMVLSAVNPAELQSMSSLEQVASRFNAAGELCKGAGMKFAYHNHDFDFQPFEGTVPLDYLIEHTDPATVAFQLDVYWISKAGGDPVDYLRRYPGRFTSLHLKDLAADGSITDVGDGTIDFAAVLKQASANGLDYFFVEHDSPENPLATASRSYGHLRELNIQAGK